MVFTLFLAVVLYGYLLHCFGSVVTGFIRQIFVFFKISRPALSLTQPSFQSVLGSFPGIKQSGSGVGNLPPCTAEVDNDWGYNPSPLLCLHGVNRDRITILKRKR